MKVTFYSNFLNHHQLPLCKEMYKLLGENYKFVATEPVPEERLKMGYLDMSTMYPFSLNTYDSEENYDIGLKLGYESDIVIIGSAPRLYIDNRLNHNKLTFYYYERIFRKGRWEVFNPRTFLSLYKNHIAYKKKNLYMLCASAYTAADFSLVGAYKNKAYKWGYFPEVKDHDIATLMRKKDNNEIPKLLWVGRLLALKHPDDAIQVVRMLKNKGYEFTLDIIGTGYMEGVLKNLIKKYKISDRVNLLGSMKPEEVREHMEAANIYLFTSDFNEGWGAVLNESMNSGCAVVASHAIGSVPFLIKNKENGLIYKKGDLKHLYQCVKMLLNDRELCKKLGEEAYKSLEKTWNAKEAAKRFIQLANGLLKDENVVFQDGPCSKAEIIKNNWWKVSTYE